MKARPPLKVALFGMDSRTKQIFAMFCNGPAKGYVNIVPEGQHEAVVLHLDGAGSESLWLEARQRFSCPTLLLSVQERNHPNGVWLENPIKSEDLINAVELLRAKLPKKITSPESDDEIVILPEFRAATSSQNTEYGAGNAAKLVFQERESIGTFGTIPDELYFDEKESSEVLFNPDEYVVGFMRESIKIVESNGRPVVIEGLGRSLAVLPGRRVFMGMRESYLRPLCSSVINRRHVSIKQVNDLADIHASHGGVPQVQSLDGLLWKAALWASRGRVPLDTDLAKPISLRSWPNLTRIEVTPGAIQIAALWSSQPTSLHETAKKLAILPRHVFSFYAACHALDLVEQMSKSVINAQEKKAPATRSLLRSVLKKLRLS